MPFVQAASKSVAPSLLPHWASILLPGERRRENMHDDDHTFTLSAASKQTSRPVAYPPNFVSALAHAALRLPPLSSDLSKQGQPVPHRPVILQVLGITPLRPRRLVNTFRHLWKRESKGGCYQGFGAKEGARQTSSQPAGVWKKQTAGQDQGLRATALPRSVSLTLFLDSSADVFGCTMSPWTKTNPNGSSSLLAFSLPPCARILRERHRPAPRRISLQWRCLLPRAPRCRAAAT